MKDVEKSGSEFSFFRVYKSEAIVKKSEVEEEAKKVYLEVLLKLNETIVLFLHF